MRVCLDVHYEQRKAKGTKKGNGIINCQNILKYIGAEEQI